MESLENEAPKKAGTIVQPVKGKRKIIPNLTKEPVNQIQEGLAPVDNATYDILMGETNNCNYSDETVTTVKIGKSAMKEKKNKKS